MGDFTTWPSGSAGASATADAAITAVVVGAAMGADACGIVIMPGCPGIPTRLILTFSSPSVISSSAMPDSCTRSISFFSFLRSISQVLFRGDVGNRIRQRVFVTSGAQAADGADRQIAEIRMAPE